MIFTTVCSDNYSQYLIKLIKSILLYNPGFNYEFIVFHDGRLTIEGRNRLLQEYPFIFIDFDFAEYESAYKPSIKYASMESFRLNVGGPVIFLDSDLLCLGSIGPIIKHAETAERIGMAREMRRNTEIYNSGLIIIPDSFISEEKFKEMLDFDLSKIDCQLNDQKLYNHYFNDIERLPNEWNCMVSETSYVKKENIIFLHYIYKPDTEASINLDGWAVESWHKI